MSNYNILKKGPVFRAHWKAETRNCLKKNMMIDKNENYNHKNRLIVDLIIKY